MNLYLIKRTPDYFVSDAYACAIVAAKDGQAAKHTHPVRGVIWRGESWCKGGKNYGLATWTEPGNVRPRLLGKAVRGMKAGIVCAFFN
jgi:hypothetical protein